ncbi:MAG: TIGR00159 family protein [Planctomycetes bacterium]|nr:TIGR00159 family protein [Planctomycetota bacterium]
MNRLPPLAAIVEILVLTYLLYAIFKFMKGTRGAGILRGLGILMGVVFLVVYVVANLVGFIVLSPEVLGRTFGYVILSFVMLFQPELRRGLVRLGQHPIMQRILKNPNQVTEEVLRAVERMAKRKVGALLALERSVGLGEYTADAAEIDAVVSAEALCTIFTPGSDLHDGGVVLRGDRIAAAGCFFPLSDSQDLSKSMGGRHRAGLGLSETSDAFVIIVSEETGEVSVALHGRLHGGLDRAGLSTMLLAHGVEGAAGAGSVAPPSAPPSGADAAGKSDPVSREASP